MAHDAHLRHSQDVKSASHLKNAADFIGAKHQGDGNKNTMAQDKGPMYPHGGHVPSGKSGLAETNSMQLPSPKHKADKPGV